MEKSNNFKSSGKSQEVSKEEYEVLQKQMQQLQQENYTLIISNDQNFRGILLQELQMIRVALADLKETIVKVSSAENSNDKDEDDEDDEDSEDEDDKDDESPSKK